MQDHERLFRRSWRVIRGHHRSETHRPAHAVKLARVIPRHIDHRQTATAPVFILWPIPLAATICHAGIPLIKRHSKSAHSKIPAKS
jgi:hypothetical protein